MKKITVCGISMLFMFTFVSGMDRKRIVIKHSSSKEFAAPARRHSGTIATSARSCEPIKRSRGASLSDKMDSADGIVSSRTPQKIEKKKRQ